MAVEVVSIMEFAGDPDELVARMQDTINPVAERKAPEYGGVSSTICRTDNGIMVINMWDSKEGRHRMADDPEVREAIQQGGFPPPSAKGYDVIAHRVVQGATV